MEINFTDIKTLNNFKVNGEELKKVLSAIDCFKELALDYIQTKENIDSLKYNICLNDLDKTVGFQIQILNFCLPIHEDQSYEHPLVINANKNNRTTIKLLLDEAVKARNCFQLEKNIDDIVIELTENKLEKELETVLKVATKVKQKAMRKYQLEEEEEKK